MDDRKRKITKKELEKNKGAAFETYWKKLSDNEKKQILEEVRSDGYEYAQQYARREINKRILKDERAKRFRILKDERAKRSKTNQNKSKKWYKGFKK